MTSSWLKILSVFVGLALIGLASPTRAQTEIPPPQGKGRVVVVASGASGPEHYMTVARAIAKLGYDVVLYDGNKLTGTKGQALKTAVALAPQLPHALPGKVALVGFSLGGGVALIYGSQWPDQVAADIVWYPETTVIPDVNRFANAIKLPVLMFAGEADTYKNCCLITTARTLEAAAKAGGKPYELHTYPGTDHDFVEGGSHYNSKSYKDALDKTAARLKEAFAE